MSIKNILELKGIEKVIAVQREKGKKEIKEYISIFQSNLHPTEFKLLKNLVIGLEHSLIIEYMSFQGKNPPLFDIWAFKKIADIYQKSY